MKKLTISLLLNDIRSAYNVGSILRTAEAAGVDCVILAGLTPHPPYPGDPRLTHIAAGAARKLAKTALGAERTLNWRYEASAERVIKSLKAAGTAVYALEIVPEATSLFDWQPRWPLVLTLGHESAGTDKSVLALADEVIKIPMTGQKESLNVGVACGIAVYWLSYHFRL